jgi:hypothetical protein
VGVLPGTGSVAGLASGGLIIGTLIPGVVLVTLGMVFLGQGNESAAPMTASNLLPAWAGLSSVVLIVNNFLSYSGMEMNAVHVSSLRNPAKERRTRRTTWMVFTVVFVILGGLALFFYRATESTEQARERPAGSPPSSPPRACGHRRPTRSSTCSATTAERPATTRTTHSSEALFTLLGAEHDRHRCRRRHPTTVPTDND